MAQQQDANTEYMMSLCHARTVIVQRQAAKLPQTDDQFRPDSESRRGRAMN